MLFTDSWAADLLLLYLGYYAVAVVAAFGSRLSHSRLFGHRSRPPLAHALFGAMWPMTLTMSLGGWLLYGFLSTMVIPLCYAIAAVGPRPVDLPPGEGYHDDEEEEGGFMLVNGDEVLNNQCDCPRCTALRSIVSSVIASRMAQAESANAAGKDAPKDDVPHDAQNDGAARS